MTNGVKGKKNACSSSVPPAPASAMSAAENRPRTSTGARLAGSRCPVPQAGRQCSGTAVQSWGTSDLCTAVAFHLHVLVTLLLGPFSAP